MAELDVGKEILMPESRRCYPKVFRVNFESTTSVTVLIQDQVGLLQLAARVYCLQYHRSNAKLEFCTSQ